MTSKNSENEFLKNFGLLNGEQQKKVLAYVRSLLKRTKGTPMQNLLQFAGSIDTKSIQEISTAIGEDCENVDKNEW